MRGRSQDAPVGRRPCLLGIQVDARKVPDRAFDGERFPLAGRTGVLDSEGPDRGSAKAHEVRAAAERTTDVGHEDAYVRAARAGDPNLDVSPVERRHLERVDADPARGGLESVALARSLVELAPADLDGGVRGRRLQRIADQGGACPFDLGSRDVDGSRSHDLAVGIQGVGLLAEAPRRRVRLREVAEVAQEACRSSDAEDQQAGGHRVQRARVADLARSERSAHHVDDVVRGHAGGLVDQHQPLDPWSHRRATEPRDLLRGHP